MHYRICILMKMKVELKLRLLVAKIDTYLESGLAFV
jgi:hypothetical protein